MRSDLDLPCLTSSSVQDESIGNTYFIDGQAFENSIVVFQNFLNQFKLSLSLSLT